MVIMGAFILLIFGLVVTVFTWSWIHDKLTKREEVDMETYTTIMETSTTIEELEDQIARMIRSVRTSKTRKLLMEDLGTERYTFYLRKAVKRC